MNAAFVNSSPVKKGEESREGEEQSKGCRVSKLEKEDALLRVHPLTQPRRPLLSWGRHETASAWAMNNKQTGLRWSLNSARLLHLPQPPPSFLLPSPTERVGVLFREKLNKPARKHDLAPRETKNK